jgi:flavin-binding protein dodecin
MTSIAKTTEIIASSTKSFDDAVKAGIERACKTLENVAGAWVQHQRILDKENKITEYRVTLKITFVLSD